MPRSGAEKTTRFKEKSAFSQYDYVISQDSLSNRSWNFTCSSLLRTKPMRREKEFKRIPAFCATIYNQNGIAQNTLLQISQEMKILVCKTILANDLFTIYFVFYLCHEVEKISKEIMHFHHMTNSTKTLEVFLACLLDAYLKWRGSLATSLTWEFQSINKFAENVYCQMITLFKQNKNYYLLFGNWWYLNCTT